MARKSPLSSWLQVFQKPKSVDEEPRLRSIPAEESFRDVLVETEPETIEAAPEIEIPVRSSVKTAAKELPQPTRRRVRRVGSLLEAWKWQLIWLSVLTAVGGTGAVAFLWLSKVPPAIDCQQISAWSADSERLYCAQQGAQSGKPEQLLEAIRLVKDWSTDHFLYAQAQVLLQDWSNGVLILARDRVAQKDLKGAISLASQIPRTSAVYKEAQAAVKYWQEEFNKGQVIYDKIQAALKKQNWDLASQQLAQLSLISDPSWQDRLTGVRRQITTEKQAWQALKEARSFAKANPPERLGRAIALTDSIKRTTYVWSLQAQAEVLRWRNTVFALAVTRLNQQDLAGASSLVDSMPASVKLTSANRDLIWLIRAKQVEADRNYAEPGLERLAPIMVATHLLRQISAQSPFYAQAKALAPRLEMQSRDLIQLNFASTIANLRQIPTLQTAIAQAQQIPRNHPRRLHAQTMIAQWQKEVEWMEDRPIFRQAQQLAKTGKLEQLRSAVALVRLIRPKRALYSETQSSMASWTAQIQVIEDTPILSEAKAIAATGKLGQAIQVASKIRSDRALYQDAQYLIGNWTYQIQIAEDRPTLNQAASLASQGYLTRAIDLASQISPGRALYGEAQGAIARWAVERAEIWRQREEDAAIESEDPEPQSEDSDQSSDEESTSDSEDTAEF